MTDVETLKQAVTAFRDALVNLREGIRAEFPECVDDDSVQSDWVNDIDAVLASHDVDEEDEED